MTRTPVFDAYGQLAYYTNPGTVYIPTAEREPLSAERMRWELAVHDWPCS